MDKEEKLLTILHLILAVITVTIALPISGVVFSDLWNWFVAEPFNISQINWAYSTGLLVLIKFSQPTNLNKNNDKDVSERIADTLTNFVLTLIIAGYVWLLGYLIHTFLV